MQSETKKVIAVDLGGTNIRAALAQTNGKLLNVARMPTYANKGKEIVLDRIEYAVREAAGDNWDEVTGIGMISPGPLDPRDGVVVYAPNLKWENVPLKAIYEQRLNRPVRIGNDANLAALAEHQFGAGKGLRHLVYLTISTGIGGGIIVDNRLLLGARGLGAEAGQIVVDINSPMYASDIKGSIESLASGPAIARRARGRITDFQGQGIVEAAGSVEAVTAKHVGQAAANGDPLAITLLTEAGEMIGFAVISLMSLFNPEIIVIGGGVSKVGNLLFDPIKKIVQENLHPSYWEDCPIVPATLGEDVGLLGGVALLNSPPNR